MNSDAARPAAPLTVGISQCLLGNPVRFDGSGAASSFPRPAFDGLFEYQQFCPEVGIGMGVPRDPIRLVGDAEQPRAVGVKDPSQDVTSALERYAKQSSTALGELSGYIFMHNSPSCGTRRVKVYPAQNAQPIRNGQGIYAAQVRADFPNLPIEDGDRLFDAVLRENFVIRVFAYAHWQRVLPELSAAGLITFHSRYKYLLMAHSQVAYSKAGRLLSDLSIGDWAQMTQSYISVLMEGLAQPANRLGHANVLAHLAGYLKRDVDRARRQELDQLIQAYRRGEQPLSAPMKLLRHHLDQHPDPYVTNQIYFEPFPVPPALRTSSRAL